MSRGRRWERGMFHSRCRRYLLLLRWSLWWIGDWGGARRFHEAVVCGSLR